jgi:WD40 repeat protein/DNA-binding SARP family transcriptional activator
MDVHLLGSVKATVDGAPVEIGPGKPRALLALLALRAGTPVSSDALIDGLWGEQAPATATKLVQQYISQLRRALGDEGDRIVTRGHGYALEVDAEHIDVGRFERLVGDGEGREALALWHGAPLQGVDGEPFAEAERPRLEELHRTAVEQAVDEELAAGSHAEVIGHLQKVIREDPLRERPRAQLMLALYRSGRQSEALEAFRAARRTLVEEIGVDPGPELVALHDAILRHDPSLRAPEAPRAVDVCPFKGLAAFEPGDADYFFGRERLVREIVGRLAAAPFTALAGMSGSGKSSLLRAGVIPAVTAGALPGFAHAQVALLRPGQHPIAALERALGDDASERRLVVVDQFEEAFTQCEDEDERASFIARLVTLAADGPGAGRVLIGIRADFYGACATYPDLARLVSASHVLMGPMRRDELRQAVERPAAKAGLRVEPELTEALVAGVEGEPGALPLLSSSLLELWQLRDGDVLRLADFERAGGVRGAVARLAEGAYARLTPEDQEIARGILLRLAADTDAGEAAVRRRVPLADACGPGAEHVLAILADARLVTVGDDEVEVAHEALLREWPRLRSWLEDDVQGRRLHVHLMRAAREWDAAGRDPAELYRGARLAAALDWVEGHRRELNACERAFLEASRAVAGREVERERATNRRLRGLLIGVAAMLAIAVAAGIFALSERGEAEDAALTADAQRAGAAGLTRDRIDEAALLSRAGSDLQDSNETRSNLLAMLVRAPAALGALPTDGFPVTAVAVSGDERWAASGTERGYVEIFDARRRRVVGRYLWANGGYVQQLTFSPDGRTLVVAGYAAPGATQPVVDLVDPATRQRRLRIIPPPYPGTDDLVGLTPRFLPNGRDLIVQQWPLEPGPSILHLYDGTTGERTRGPLSVGRRAANWMSTTTDGRRAVHNEPGLTVVVDTERLRVVKRLREGEGAAAISSDGRFVALGSEDGELRVVDVASGQTRAFEGAHEGEIGRLLFADDDRTVVAAGNDGKLTLWDVRDGALHETLTGHERGDVNGLQTTGDARTVYSGASDGRVMIWDVGGRQRLDQPFDVGAPFLVEADPSPRGLAVSPDGQTVAVGQIDGTVHLVDARTLQRRRSLRAVDGVAAGAAFSHDGRLLAVSGARGQITVWDARTLRKLWAPNGYGGPRGFTGTAISQGLAFSPDDRLLAGSHNGTTEGGARDGTVMVWDVRTRRRLMSFKQFAPASLAFSTDGRVLAANAIQSGAEVREARTGRRIKLLRLPDEARTVAFSPDGKLLATGDYSGETRLWSTSDYEPVGRRMEGHTARVQALEFSPDGRTLVTGGSDGKLQLWDVASQTQLGASLTVEPNTAMAAKFSPDGSFVFAASELHRAVRWDVRPDAWKAHACRIAGRTMTGREWADTFPDRPYRPVCQSALGGSGPVRPG